MINNNFISIWHRLRYGDIFVENPNFPTPTHLASSIGLTLLEVREILKIPGRKVFHGAESVDFVILACIVLIGQQNSKRVLGQ